MNTLDPFLRHDALLHRTRRHFLRDCTSGLGALSPARDLTLEAFGEYLDLLSDTGLLAVTHALEAPPPTA